MSQQIVRTVETLNQMYALARQMGWTVKNYVRRGDSIEVTYIPHIPQSRFMAGVI